MSTLYLSTLDPSQCLDSCQTRLWKPRRRSKRTAGIVDRRKTVRPITRDTCWRENEGSKRMPYTCPLPLNSPLPDTDLPHTTTITFQSLTSPPPAGNQTSHNWAGSRQAWNSGCGIWPKCGDHGRSMGEMFSCTSFTPWRQRFFFLLSVGR